MAKRSQVQKGMCLSMFRQRCGTEEKCAETLARGIRMPLLRLHEALPIRTLEPAAVRGVRPPNLRRGRNALRAREAAARGLATGHFSDHSRQKGISAIDPAHKAGAACNAAWRMKHRIMQTTAERKDEKPSAGPFQADNVYLGGVREGRRGRGAAGKPPFVAALETKEEWLPQRIKLRAAAGIRLTAIESWHRRNVAPRMTACSDGPSCFGAVAKAGCVHFRVTAGGGKASARVKELAWPDTVIGNAETALRSARFSMKGKYARRCPGEFDCRFNRRCDLPSMVSRLSWAAVRTPPISEKLLRKGAVWRLEG